MDELIEGAVGAAVSGDRRRIALLGATPAALELQGALVSRGLADRIVGIFDPNPIQAGLPAQRPWSELATAHSDLVVICVDRSKEDLLRAYADLTIGSHSFPDVVIAGMSHLDYRNAVFDELDEPALVPSYATGHPHTRIHLFQCLEAAAAAGIDGAVVELGAFKGGTTAWLARVVKRLGLHSTVFAFDSWAGFPPRQSVLDLYTHPRCVFRDVDSVRRHLEPLGVNLVVGDIAVTAPRTLRDLPVLLAFVDTDNYSGASAALKAILPNLVQGGAVVFDHLWTTSDYLYTIGERMAGWDLLGSSHLLQLHGTGVFVKLR